MDEMLDTKARGLDLTGIQLSTKAQLTFDYHKQADALTSPSSASGKKTGATKRGMCPAYSATAARVGIRAIHFQNLVASNNTYSLSLHDALPICALRQRRRQPRQRRAAVPR